MSSNSWWHNAFPRGFKKQSVEEKAARPSEPRPAKADEAHWIKCPDTGELIVKDDVIAAHWVTPSGFHMRIGAEPRFKSLFDGDWTPIALPQVQPDPLRFRDDKRYVDRLKDARAKAKTVDDCMGAAIGTIGGQKAVVLVQDFSFMGGSLGLAAGEAFVTAAQAAAREGAAFIAVTASGGARMQEGVFSLMQMPRTTLAIQEVREAGLPYIVLLTDPTSGGVTASYAMLGDVHIAEPNAMIAFSGPRVIEQTIRQKLPEGLQRAEYLLEKGMVDIVAPRSQHREIIGAILSVLMARRAALAADTDVPAPAESVAAKPAEAPAPAVTKPDVVTPISAVRREGFRGAVRPKPAKAAE